MKHSLNQWLQKVTLVRLMSSSCHILPCVLLFAVTVHADDSKLFLEKVAPILETHCLRCHYPGNEEGDVSLATPDDLRDGGYLDVRNGDQSHLLDLVEPVRAGKKPEMPEDGDPLSSEQVGVLRKWVVHEPPISAKPLPVQRTRDRRLRASPVSSLHARARPGPTNGIDLRSAHQGNLRHASRQVLQAKHLLLRYRGNDSASNASRVWAQPSPETVSSHRHEPSPRKAKHMEGCDRKMTST